MPYVEVWVDKEDFDEEQVKAISELVKTCRRVAMRLWPSDDARDLEHAASDFVRAGVPVGDRNHSGELEFEVDKKYREWLLMRSASGQELKP